MSDAVATASVDDGRFRRQLPGSVDGDLLEPEPIDCDRERTIAAVFLPHLTLVQDGEAVGRLVHPDVPPASFRWIFVPDAP